MQLMQFQKKIWNKFFISLIICSLVLSLFGCAKEPESERTVEKVFPKLQEKDIWASVHDYLYIPYDTGEFFQAMGFGYDQIAIDRDYTFSWAEEDWFAESIFNHPGQQHYHWTPAVDLSSGIPIILVWNERTEIWFRNHDKFATQSFLSKAINFGSPIRVAGKAYFSKIYFRYKGYKYDNIGNLSQHVDFSHTIGQQMNCLVVEASIMEDYDAKVGFEVSKPTIFQEQFPMIGTPIEEE